MIPRPFEVLPHTADTGIATSADTLGEVIANAAFGMFALMYDVSGDPATTSLEVDVEAATPAELLLEVLAELLFRAEVDDTAYGGFAVDTDGFHASVTAEGISSDGLELLGPPIKAVTYHDLRCEQVEDHWEARVIFDV